MKKQKYALNNSYFKYRRPNDPDTPAEVVSFFKEHGELPFRYEGGNWPYDMVCERQKRRGVIRCQHLTPDATAKRMAQLAKEHGREYRYALDACCGTGQLTKELIGVGFSVDAFDIDPDMVAVHQFMYPGCSARLADFREMNPDIKYSLVVSNPPFDQQIAPEFMAWLANILLPEGRAVLILPKGYMEKSRPRLLAKTLSNFTVLHREPVTGKFAHTNGIFEIVVLESLVDYDSK